MPNYTIPPKIEMALRFWGCSERFVAESNAIEGINRNPTPLEVVEYERFVGLEKISINDLIKFVSVYQPGVRLRDALWVVGRHKPPNGGAHIVNNLNDLLQRLDGLAPYQLHLEYENLHPFTDCNGRSGRALWARQMNRCHDGCPLGFLHHWYYQSLDASRK